VGTVTFNDPAGTHRVTYTAGESLMRAGVRAGIGGIEAVCGGVLSCATCHVHVAQDWMDRLPPPSDDELAMLEFVEAPRTRCSRLSCQIELTGALDGLTVTVPRA
jgi:2Fe-2S ferredoxin